MSIDSLMEELKKEYIDSFPEKISELDTLLKKKDFTGLQNSFHKLKGSGKTYGIPEISILGEYFEKLILKNPSESLNLIPFGIQIFEKIFSFRSKNIEYEILKDSIYQDLPK